MYIHGQEEINAASRVLSTDNWFRFDAESETALFEKEFALAMETEYAAAVTSGTAALVCALAGCDAK
jgi:dTDP-4-amino-4,6-dideoxygalactose transaminase